MILGFWLLSVALAVEVIDLEVENQRNEPLIDVSEPRFGFTVHSTTPNAYIVSSTLRVFVKGAEVWRINPNSTFGIVYGGSLLPFGSEITWNVSVETTDGAAEAESRFFTGLFGLERNWGGAEYLGEMVQSSTMAQFRTEFVLDETLSIEASTCYFVGLGASAVWVNGERMNANEMMADITEWTNRTFYRAVQDCPIQGGSNAVSILLGRWWYSLRDDYFFNPPFLNPFGPRNLRFVGVVDLSNGTRLFVGQSSPSTWFQSSGLVRADNIHIGEVHDARFETVGWTEKDYVMSNATWSPAKTVPAPSPVFEAHSFPPILPDPVHTEFRPVSVTPFGEAGQYIFDLGSEISGNCRLEIPSDCPDGHTIHILHGERRLLNGTLEQSPAVPNRTGSGTLLEQSAFTCSSNPHSTNYHRPFFTLVAFRYYQVSNWPASSTPPTTDNLTCYFMHTDLPQLGSFRASDAAGSKLETIFNATQRTALINFIQSPTDSTSRESRVWCGDALAAHTFLGSAFDMRAAWTKWLRDIQLTQSILEPVGTMGDMVGMVFLGTPKQITDPAWGSVYPILYDYAWRHFEDSRILQDHYATAKSYTDFLLDQTDSSGLINASSFVGSRYGCWCAYGARDTPTNISVTIPARVSSLLSNYFLIKDLDTVVRAATALGLSSDAAKYTALAASTRHAYHEAFYHPTSGLYYDPFPPIETAIKRPNLPPPLQTSLAITLDARVPPSPQIQASTASLLDNDLSVTHGGHVQVGVVGASVLFNALARNGHANASLLASLTETMPSYYHMASTSGTIWEHWDVVLPNGTYNEVGTMSHIMLGGSTSWLIEDFVGIQPQNFLSPKPLSSLLFSYVPSPDISAASSSRWTPRGLAMLEYSFLSTSLVKVSVQNPFNTSSKVVLQTLSPLSNPTVLANNQTIFADHTFHPAPGVSSASIEDGKLQVSIAGGNYLFSVEN